MLSLLNADLPAAHNAAASPQSAPEPKLVDAVPAPAPAAESELPTRTAPTEDFEIVLGRRQVASLLFVGIVIIVVASAMSYLAAKAVIAKDASLNATPLVFAPPVAADHTTPIPVVDATIAKASDAAAIIKGNLASGSSEPAAVPSSLPDSQRRADEPELPLFRDPLPGAVYIQMGAVEKGIAIILAEGLRKRGFDASVAPGPNERIFRVLIGPLPNPAAFQRAKEGVDQLGLSTFARRYEK